MKLTLMISLSTLLFLGCGEDSKDVIKLENKKIEKVEKYTMTKSKEELADESSQNNRIIEKEVYKGSILTKSAEELDDETSSKR